jgi:hypothetical protein
MRYCPNCRRINPGRPLICHYCGRTWYIRLCPRSHLNPYNAIYCGTCGSTDLSEVCRSTPWFSYLLKIIIIVILFGTIFSIGKVFLQSLNKDTFSLLFIYVISIILLIGVYLFLISMLPDSIKGFFTKLNKFCLNCFKTTIVWLLKKAKELFKLILNI